MCFRKKANKRDVKEKANKIDEKNVKEKSLTDSQQSQKVIKNKETIKEKDKKSDPEKTKKAIYRVIFSKENNVWQIKKDGAKRVIDSKITKEEALERVKQLSESQEIKFVVHKKDGKFQKKSNLR